MMTAYAELDITIDAIRKGAFDFLLKPFKPEYLAHSVKKAIDHYRLIQLEKNYTSTLENTVKNRTRELSDALTLVKSASKEIVSASRGSPSTGIRIPGNISSESACIRKGSPWH